MMTNATASAVNSRSRALKRIQRPFFGDVGLSCAYCEKQALVDWSAPIAFSSCPVDRNPLVARGSFSIARSVRFWLDSRIKLL
jgi:hypothetical protein